MTDTIRAIMLCINASVALFATAIEKQAWLLLSNLCWSGLNLTIPM